MEAASPDLPREIIKGLSSDKKARPPPKTWSPKPPKISCSTVLTIS
jgi:hypothetical protein